MKPSDDELWTLRYYDEPLTDEQRRRFTDDLEFRRGYDAFCRELEWIERHAGDPAADPAQLAVPGLADRIWKGLEPQLAGGAGPQRVPALSQGTSRYWKPAMAAMAAMALAASLLLVFLAGVWVGKDEKALTAEQRQKVLDNTMERHLRRSGDLLTELTNLSPAATGRDLAGERDRAAELASDNRLYRQTLAGAGSSVTLETLDTLESVLTELANLPPEAAASEILALRRRVQRLGLLLRLEMLNPTSGGDRV